MDASAASETRRLRRSLACVGIVLLGAALLAILVLGFWNTHLYPGARAANAPPQTSPPFNPLPYVVLGISLSLIVEGVVGSAWQRRFARRAL